MGKKTLKEELDKLGLNQEREDPREDVLRAHQKAVIAAKSDLPDAEEREHSATHSVTVKLPDIAAHAVQEKYRKVGSSKKGYRSPFKQALKRIIDDIEKRRLHDPSKSMLDLVIEKLKAEKHTNTFSDLHLTIDDIEEDTIVCSVGGKSKEYRFDTIQKYISELK